MLSFAPAAPKKHFLLSSLCIIAFGVFVVLTWDWPLMGDSGYLHYVVFLTHHGRIPYHDIIEMNTPASYITEGAAMWIFGAGAHGWRVFDLTLITLCTSAYVYIMRPAPAIGMLAGTLLLTLHGQDGVMVAGERDLTAGVLQIVGTALLIYGTGHLRRHLRWLLVSFAGLLTAWAACIKPTTGVFCVFVVFWLWRLLREHSDRYQMVCSTIFGMLAAPLICLLYLSKYHALLDYFDNIRRLAVYHASLDRRPIGYLVTHAFSTLLPVIVLAFLCIAFTRRIKVDQTDLLILGGVISGVVSYVIQGKGFSYQRYPLSVFLIIFCLKFIIDSTETSSSLAILRSVAISGCCLVCLLYLYKLGRYSHTDPDLPLAADLRKLGALTDAQNIQCLDTNGPCIETLYKHQLIQDTGFIYDCYFDSDTRQIPQDYANALNWRSSSILQRG